MGVPMNCCRTLLLILIPVLLLFILFIPKAYQPHDTHELKFSYQMGWVYVLFLMGFYWILNVFNITATAFLALITVPLLGILTAKTLADAFMSDHNVTVFGSITLMLAADSCGIRRRATLLILKHSSGSIRWIFIDIYLATVWISMWINSSAATYFMIRVLDDAIESLKTEIPSGALGQAPVKSGDDSEGKGNPKGNDSKIEMEAPKESESAKSNNASKKEDSKEDPSKQGAEPASEPSKVNASMSPEEQNELLLNGLGGELLYCIAVAANIGGTLWPYGNPMGFDIMKMKYTIPKVKKGPLIIIGLTEASWIIYMLPLLIINASIALWFLMSAHFGNSSRIFNCLRPKTAHATDFVQNKESLKAVGIIFSEKYANLPKWNTREKSLLIMIIITIAVCLTRRPVFMNGWNEMVHRRLDPAKACDGLRLDIGDSVSLTIMVLVLFILPAWGLDVFKGPPPELKKKGKGKSEKPAAPAAPPTKLTWKKLQTFYPYTVMMLIGGATCFGRHSEKPFAVPMSEYLVRTIDGNNTALLKLVMILLTLAISCFLPNPGTSATIMNLWYDMMIGYKGKVHGASILPILSVASLCFVFPSSSVPTALVYISQGKKKLSVWHFLRLGLPLLLCTLIPTIIYALLWSPNCLSIILL